MNKERLWRIAAACCLMAIAAMLLYSCDKPLRFPFRIYPSTEENADTVPLPPAPEIIPDAATDYDGNVYDAVRIGDQVWLRQNMRTTHYADGTPIPNGGIHISDSTAYYYEIPNANKDYYGLLYNWPAAVRGNAGKTYAGDVQGVCPDGWHVPSDEEWDELERYVSSVPGYTCSDDTTYIASALAADTGWRTPEESHADPENAAYLLGAKKRMFEQKERDDHKSFTPRRQENNNATGFTAVPAGQFTSGFDAKGKEANFWTASRSHDVYVWYRYLNAGSPVVYKTYNSRDYGFSVRCVKNAGM